MSYLKCTQKLLTAAGLPRTLPPATSVAAAAPFGDWYANLLWLARQRALLFTHEATLYSFAVVGVRRATLRRLDQLFLEHLQQNLAAEALPPPVIERALAAYQQVTMARTANRSVVGSMNNLALMLACYVQDADVRCNKAMLAVNRQLNRTPHQPLGWQFAIEALRERWLGAYAVPGQPYQQVWLN